MITILTIYAAISMTFCLGFVAGAWWSSRARIHDRDDIEAKATDRDHEQAAIFVRP